MIRGEIAPAFDDRTRSGKSTSAVFDMPADATEVILRMPHSTPTRMSYMPTPASRVMKTIEISVNGGAWRLLTSSDTVGGVQPRPESRGGGFEEVTHMYKKGIPLAADRKIRVTIDVQGPPARCQFDVGFL